MKPFPGALGPVVEPGPWEERMQYADCPECSSVPVMAEHFTGRYVRLWILLTVGCWGTDTTLIQPFEEPPTISVEPADLGGPPTTEVQPLSDSNSGPEGPNLNAPLVPADNGAPELAERSLATALADPSVSTSLCRWFAANAESVVALQPSAPGATCPQRLEDCEEARNGSGGEASNSTVAATGIIANLPQLLVEEECELPADVVDLCAAEFVRYIAPYAAEVTCEQPELELPEFTLLTVVQLPSCLGLVPGCPQILQVLTDAVGGEE